MEQQGEALAWVGPVVEDALGAGSPILRSFQAGEAPSFYALATAALVQHGLDHPDREILFMAEVFLAVAELLLRTDPETSDHEEIAAACGELGRLGAWLAASEPQTLDAARRLIVVAATIIDGRLFAPESALARGPAAELLINSAKALSWVARLP